MEKFKKYLLVILILSFIISCDDGITDSTGTGDMPENFIFGINRRDWKMASVPALTGGEAVQFTDENRAKIIWYNPVEIERPVINEIFTELEMDPRKGTNRGNILTVSLIEDSKGDYPEEGAWGGVMRYIDPEVNMLEKEYFEIWIRGEEGTVYIDLGSISEDAYAPFGVLNTEDEGVPNNVLNDGEDTGLDGIPAQDGTNAHEPFDDDWYYSEGSTNYDNINGSEGNGSGAAIDYIRIPDTEDLNKDGKLNLENDFYRFAIFLGDNSGSGEYVVDGIDNQYGWRLYRIPFDEYFTEIGDLDFWNITYVRIWITDIPKRAKISIY